MQAKFDNKTNTLTIEGVSINPKADGLSESKKSISLGFDRTKLSIDGREATIAVNVYVPTKKPKK